MDLTIKGSYERNTAAESSTKEQNDGRNLDQAVTNELDEKNQRQEFALTDKVANKEEIDVESDDRKAKEADGRLRDFAEETFNKMSQGGDEEEEENDADEAGDEAGEEEEETLEDDQNQQKQDAEYDQKQQYQGQHQSEEEGMDSDEHGEDLKEEVGGSEMQMNQGTQCTEAVVKGHEARAAGNGDSAQESANDMTIEEEVGVKLSMNSFAVWFFFLFHII